MNILLAEYPQGCAYFRSGRDIPIGGMLRLTLLETSNEHVLSLEKSTLMRFQEGVIIEQLHGDRRVMPFDELVAYFNKRNTECIAQLVEYMNNNALKMTKYVTRDKKYAKIALKVAFDEYLVICASENAKPMHLRSFTKRLRDKHGLSVNRAQLGDDRPLSVLVPIQ